MFKIILFTLIITISSLTVFYTKPPTKICQQLKLSSNCSPKKILRRLKTYFDDVVKGKISAAKLEEVWNGLESQVGKYKSQNDVKTAKTENSEIVITTTEFENAKLNIQLAFDGKGKIIGLFFKPVEAADEKAETYQAPAYAKPDLFTEKEVTVGSGKLVAARDADDAEG